MIICKSELCVYNKDGKCTAEEKITDGCGESVPSDYKVISNMDNISIETIKQIKDEISDLFLPSINGDKIAMQNNHTLELVLMIIDKHLNSK